MTRTLGIRKGNASKLLLETPEAYYWAGFIAADGHISNNKRVVITLSIKDSEHLKKFANFIETKSWTESVSNGFRNCSVTIQDPEIVEQFAYKFDFVSNKTLNPPNLFWLSCDRFISFICGFIDGDGCIKKQWGRDDSLIVIKGHSSWKENYKFFENQIYLESKIEKFNPELTVKINNSGYVRFHLSDRRVLNFLKNKTVELNLPILNRKWEKININLPKSRYETSGPIKSNIFRLRKNGLRLIDIAKELQISIGYISMVLSGKR